MVSIPMCLKIRYKDYISQTYPIRMCLTDVILVSPIAEFTKQNMDHSRSKLKSSKFESSEIRYSDIFSDMRSQAFLLTLPSPQDSSLIIIVSP